MPPQQIIFTNTDIDIEKLKWKEYLNSEIQVQKEMRKVMKEMDDEFGEGSFEESIKLSKTIESFYRHLYNGNKHKARKSYDKSIREGEERKAEIQTQLNDGSARPILFRAGGHIEGQTIVDTLNKEIERFKTVGLQMLNQTKY